MARAQGPDEDPGSDDAGSANPRSRSPSSGSKLPVEDPTLDVSQPEGVSEGDGEEPAKRAPEDDSEQTKDWGQKMQVAYGYQGGLLVGVDD